MLLGFCFGLVAFVGWGGLKQSHPRGVFILISCSLDADVLCRRHAIHATQGEGVALFSFDLFTRACTRNDTDNATTYAVSSFNRPGMFKCLKNVLRQRTGGCGAFNLESDQMCSQCNQRLWESIELDG